MRISKRGLGQADLASNLLAAGNSEVIIRSQVTPEIRINLAALLAGKGKEETYQSEGGSLAMSIIKPEILIRSAGLEKSVAPYGKPTQDYTTLLLAGGLGSLLLGSAVAYWFCKR